MSIHKQLNIKAIPTCHIYHPLSLSSGLDGLGRRPVEELKMDRKSWSLLERVMKWYVDGSCDLGDFNGGDGEAYGHDNKNSDDGGYLDVEL